MLRCSFGRERSFSVCPLWDADGGLVNMSLKVKDVLIKCVRKELRGLRKLSLQLKEGEIG